MKQIAKQIGTAVFTALSIVGWTTIISKVAKQGAQECESEKEFRRLYREMMDTGKSETSIKVLAKKAAFEWKETGWIFRSVWKKDAEIINDILGYKAI